MLLRLPAVGRVRLLEERGGGSGQLLEIDLGVGDDEGVGALDSVPHGLHLLVLSLGLVLVLHYYDNTNTG